MRRLLEPIGAAALLVAAVVVPLLASTTGLDVATSILVFAILAVGLSLVVVQSGLPSLGHAAFFGIGAYAVALLAERSIFNPWLVLVAAVGGAALFAAAVGPVLLRTRAEYFLMATVAVGEILRTMADSWRSVTNGSDGLYGPLRPTVLGLDLSDDVPFYYAALASLALIVLIVWCLGRSPFGHTVRAARDNRRRVSAVGVRTFTVEYLTLVISAAIGGFAGMLFAYANTFVSPGVFSLETSGTVLLMVALVRSHSVLAPVVGAIVIEGFRGLGSQITDRWMLILGAIYILIAIDVPRRLLGRRPAAVTGGSEPRPGPEDGVALAGAAEARR
jgi:branched-chain amino acid transport system permease protein